MKIHGYLKRHLCERACPDAKEAIAFALLCIDMGQAGIKDLEIARKYLQSSPAFQLSEVCIQYYPFLIDGSSSNTNVRGRLDRAGENIH